MDKEKCLRCSHKWYKRTPKKPMVCPLCKSPYWDIPRKNKTVLNFMGEKHELTTKDK